MLLTIVLTIFIFQTVLMLWYAFTDDENTTITLAMILPTLLLGFITTTIKIVKSSKYRQAWKEDIANFWNGYAFLDFIFTDKKNVTIVLRRFRIDKHYIVIPNTENWKEDCTSLKDWTKQDFEKATKRSITNRQYKKLMESVNSYKSKYLTL